MDSYAAFRSRDYRFFLAGSFASVLGRQMLSVAVSWDLYLDTKSAIVLGNVGFVQVAPFLIFALLAGHYADRLDRRRIMIYTQLLVTAASGLLLSAAHPVVLIYSALFLISSARAFQGPARLAVLPHVVPEGALRNAITWNSSAQEVANLGGPAVAGLLIAWTGSWSVYLVQIVCGVLTLICFLALRVRFAPNLTRPVGSDRKALLEGVRFVARHKLILPAISLDLFAMLFGGMTALLPIFAVDILQIGATGLGWLRAAPSAGAVLTAILLSHSPRLKHAGPILLGSIAGFGAATVVFGWSRSLWLSFLMLALSGALDNINVVLRQSLLQTRTPDSLKGRVLAVQSIFVSCSNQLGAVESGWTAAWLGAVVSVVGGGLATIAITAAFAVRSQALRKWSQ